MDMEKEVLKITCELYKQLHISRNDVTFILNIFRGFIRNIYNPHLLRRINSSLSEVLTEPIISEMNRIFNKYNDPFKIVSTEDKRFRLYRTLGMYMDPELVNVKEMNSITARRNVINIGDSNAKMIHLSIKHSYQKIFQTEGLLEATISNMNTLMSEKKVLSNFVQGKQWREFMRNFHGDEITLPMLLYFDDVETGNAQGSHSGKNSVGCIYSTIACYPASFASKLESIIITDIFYTKDRKCHGNEAVTRRLVDEIKELRKTGLVVKVKGRFVKIYLIVSLLLGDNLGLNSLLGFVASFSNTVCCRICYAKPDEIKTLTEENKNILRTKEKYSIDIKSINMKESGIKEYSILNELPDFNVIENSCLDSMHDILEGVGNYIMTRLLLYLIEEKYFTLSYFNSILKTMDFGFEKCNVPIPIVIDYVKQHNKLRMSASEILFFIRYFGLMVGHLVPPDCDMWSLYVTLRDIVNIITSPDISPTDLLLLDPLIKNINELWLKLEGNLTLKFHNLLHYIRMIEKNGPIIKVSSIRFESKHREVKAILHATASRINIVKTVGIRVMLSLMHFEYSTYQNLYIDYGSTVRDEFLHSYFPSFKTKKRISYVTINDFTYKTGVIIVSNMDDSGIEFGEIEKIFIIDDNIHFSYTPYKTIGFNSHQYVYSVYEETETRKIVKYVNLPCRTPCILNEKDKNLYVATRYRL